MMMMMVMVMKLSSHLHRELWRELLLVLRRPFDEPIVDRPLVCASNALALEVVTREGPVQ